MQSEKKFITDGIRQGLRCDGRSNLSSRLLEFKNNTELLSIGSSQMGVSLYSPHIICGIKGEISPSPDLSLSIEIAGKSSQHFREKLKEMTSLIEALMVRYIDKTQLIIIENKKAWKLYIDIVILQESSTNLVEHISFTIWKALSNTHLIGVLGYVNKNTQEEFLQITNQDKHLKIEEVPIIISVAMIADNLVLDIEDLEDLCIDVVLHVSVDRDGKIKGISKEGPGSISFSQTCRALSTCKSAAMQFFDQIASDQVHYKITEI